MILTGDCVAVMATLPENSVDAIVTDPPYGLEFMGRSWDKLTPTQGRADLKNRDNWVPSKSAFKDGVGTKIGMPQKNPRCRKCGKLKFDHPKGKCRCVTPDWNTRQSEYAYLMQTWHEQWATEALRVLKPGHYLLAFGGTRTVHRLTVALEDSGWIIRDMLIWAYASGFPKGRAQLKPAYEPIVLAKKPGPMVPLGIDAARIGTNGEAFSVPQSDPGKRGGVVGSDLGISGADVADFQRAQRESIERTATLGRWPSNLILTSPLFDGDTPGVVGGGQAGGGFGTRGGGAAGDWNPTDRTTSVGQTIRGGGETVGYGDTGTYSRFFALPRIIGSCQFCGVPNAGSTSEGKRTSDTQSGTAPANASSEARWSSSDHAPSAVPPSVEAGSSSAHPSALLWGDEASGSRSEHPNTNGSVPGSLSAPEPTTPRTQRSRQPATSPRSTSPSDPATSAAPSGTSSVTTTTTAGPWTCDACAALATAASIQDETSTGVEDFHGVRVEQPDYPRFLLIPKSSRSDREPNAYGRMVGGLEEREADSTYGDGFNSATKLVTAAQQDAGTVQRARRLNSHSTVKPLALMRHLVRLVVPVGGTCLDPFAGSGTTGLACELEGFDYTLIEREESYVRIIEARLAGVQRGLGLDVAAPAPKAPTPKSGVAVGGKGNAASIFGTDLQKHAAEDQGYGDEGTPSRFFMLPRDPLDEEE